MNVTLTPGSLPSGYCFKDPQSYYNDIIAATIATLPGTFNGINFGPNQPLPADQDKPWFRLNVDGTPDGWYAFSGQWIRPHPVPPSSKSRMIWTDTEAALWAYEGGLGLDPSANIPTAFSGAFWERDTNFDFKFPLGIGVNGAAVTIAPGDPGGAETVTLDVTQIPPHHHGGNTTWLYYDANVVGLAASVGGASNNNVKVMDDAGGGLPHPNMPPYRAVIFAKRTARIWIIAGT